MALTVTACSTMGSMVSTVRKLGNGSLCGGSVSSGSVNGDDSPTPSLCEEKIHGSGTATNGDVSSTCSTNSLPRSIASTPCSPQPNGGAFSITKEQLQNVQLKRTDKPSTLERCVLLQKSPCSTLAEQKSTIIEELKQSIGNPGSARREEESRGAAATDQGDQLRGRDTREGQQRLRHSSVEATDAGQERRPTRRGRRPRKRYRERLKLRSGHQCLPGNDSFLMKNGDATLPINRTLGPKPLTGTLSCPCCAGVERSFFGNVHTGVDVVQTRKRHRQQRQRQQRAGFCGHGLRKVNVRLH
ncbi:hypothetical protein MRX96_028774 [Rhipicephalus microplus]